MIASHTKPANPEDGDSWYDKSTRRIYIYSKSMWVLVDVLPEDKGWKLDIYINDTFRSKFFAKNENLTKIIPDFNAFTNNRVDLASEKEYAAFLLKWS